MSEKTPLILDVDTGTDDALALAYATRSERIDLVAVTTVAGNTGVVQATTNTLAVLDYLGADEVPVHRGASRPLVRPHRDAAYFHDASGLGGAKLAASARDEGADRGPAAMIRLARQRPGELILVCLGPLTNLAIAINVEPGIVDLLRGVVVMGGAFHVPGNITPAAEFNILVDPEAAEQVFASAFKSLTVVGLDVTEQVALTTEDWVHANRDDNLPPSARLLSEVGRFAFTSLKRERFSLHDPLAVAVAVTPEVIHTESAAVVVETVGDELGRTQVVGPGQVRVAIAVDADAALTEFRRTVGLDRA